MSEHSDQDVTIEIETLLLDKWHRRLGARMVEFAGYHMPIQYEGIMAEHVWTRSRAGLFDVSHMGQLQLWSGEGADAATALEALVPGDISALKPGRIRYSLLLNEQGGVLDDLMVTNAGDHLYLVVNGATKWDDMAYLRDMLPDEVRLAYLDDQALLALQGPDAAQALSRLVPGVADLAFMQAGTFDWNGVPLGISRSGYTGEDGFEISVPAGAAERLADALLAMEEVKPVGLGARDSLRLEAGLPLYGHDLDETINPVEASLEFAISKARRESGGFAGSDVILAAFHNGPARRRVGLSIDGRQPVREGSVVVDAAGDAIGHVTSGGFSPTLQRPIAMAFVPSALAAAGNVLTIEQRGKHLSATVVAMPFVPTRYHRKTPTA